MSDDKQMQPERYSVEPISRIYCINMDCYNLVTDQTCCNLKAVTINHKGVCDDMVKIKNKRKKNK